MSLKKQISKQLITALKNKEEARLSTLRFLQSAIKNREIELKKREEGLTDEEIVEVIAKQIKQRRDSIEQFKKGGREDLVLQEETELRILQDFMPAQMSEDEIRVVVKKVIAEGMTGFPAIMGRVMKEVKGKVEGNTVKKIVEEVTKA